MIQRKKRIGVLGPASGSADGLAFGVFKGLHLVKNCGIHGISHRGKAMQVGAFLAFFEGS